MPQPTDNTPPSNNTKPVTFSLDGQEFTLSDDKQDAADLLRLANLDINDYDLTVLRNGNAPAKPYDDDQQVHIKDGDVFLSVRRSAPVA